MVSCPVVGGYVFLGKKNMSASLQDAVDFLAAIKISEEDIKKSKKGVVPPVPEGINMSEKEWRSLRIKGMRMRRNALKEIEEFGVTGNPTIQKQRENAAARKLVLSNLKRDVVADPPSLGRMI